MRNSAKTNEMEQKFTILEFQENSCRKCWNRCSTEETGNFAPRHHFYYISENVYLVGENKRQEIICQIARCPNCGDIKIDGGRILFYKLNGKFGQRNYNYWKILKQYGIAVQELEQALIAWPPKKSIVLDPAKNLKYSNELEPRSDETFTQYAYRYLYECKKANKWL